MFWSNTCGCFSQNIVKFINKKYFFNRLYSSHNPYNILFFGSDGIALSSLQKVNEFRKQEKTIDRLHLVTANSSKHKSTIEKYAQAEGIKTISWPLHELHHGEYDIGLIVAFGHLIKDHVLSKFPLGILNIHPSLLPRWRGAAPIIHTLLNGDEVTGVTLMKIKPNVFDVGEIISQQSLPVSKDIKLPELTKQLSGIGAEMLVDCLKNLSGSLAGAKPQSDNGVTYARKIHKSISEVRWSEMSTTEVYNLYRAIYGIYSVSTTFRDKKIKLFGAFLDNTNEIEHRDIPVGSLEYCDKTNSIKVLCKDRKYIHFRTLRIVGKREIKAIDFHNGYIKNVPIDKRICIVC